MVSRNGEARNGEARNAAIPVMVSRHGEARNGEARNGEARNGGSRDEAAFPRRSVTGLESTLRAFPEQKRRGDALERPEAMVATRSHPAKKLAVIACVPPCPRSIGMPLPKVSLQLLRNVGHTSRPYVVCLDQ
eukprot:scaffold141352_cov130-Phaeocystis_antarctica.AAC.3